MKNIIIVLMATFFLSSCGNDDNNVLNNNGNDNNIDITTTTPFEPQNIGTEVILKSSLSRLYALTEFNHIIKNQNELDDILSEAEFNEHIKNRILTNIADVDFGQYQLLAVFNPITMGSGATIDIISVTEYNDNIVVVLDNIYGKEFQFLDIAFPYEIVKMPKIDKPVIFDTSLLWNPYDD